MKETLGHVEQFHASSKDTFEQYLDLRFTEESAFEKKLLLSIRRQVLEGDVQIKSLLFSIGLGNGNGKTTLIRKLVEGSPLKGVGIQNPEIPCLQFDSYAKLQKFVVENDNFIVLLSWKYLHAHKQSQESSYKKIHDIIIAAQQKNALIIFEDYDLPCSKRYDERFVFRKLFKAKIQIREFLPERYRLHAMKIQGLWLDQHLAEYLIKHSGSFRLSDFHCCLTILAALKEPITAEIIRNTIILLGYEEIIDDGVEGLASLKGRDLLKEELMKIATIRSTLKNIKGLVKVPSYLFIGAPGTGKTFSVRCLSKEIGIPIEHIDYETLMDAADQLPVAVKRVFKEVFRGPPSILFVDEAEKLFGKSDYTCNDGPVQAEFQQIIDGIYNHEFKGILILSANTTHPFSQPLLDRFKVIKFDLPSKQDRLAYLTFKAGLLEPELRAMVLENHSIEEIVAEIGEKSYREIDRKWTDLVLFKLTEGVRVTSMIVPRTKREVDYVG